MEGSLERLTSNRVIFVELWQRVRVNHFQYREFKILEFQNHVNSRFSKAKIMHSGFGNSKNLEFRILDPKF